MKLNKLIFILFILLLTSNFDAFSKTTEHDSIISISGQIIHADSLSPIPLATISIKRTKKGIICDSLGVFHLQVQQYDTLRISALGYRKIEWVVPLIINPDFPPFFRIKLKDTSYLLGEVEIHALGTWKNFKNEFIHTDLPKENKLSIDFKISEVEMQNIRDKIAVQNNSTFDFLGAFVYYGGKLLCKKKKTKVIVSDEIKKRHEQILDSKYNKNLIAQLTHEKGSQLDRLTAFINSQTNFTYESNELSIQNKIMALYKKFKLNPEIIEKQTFVIDSSKQINNHLRP